MRILSLASVALLLASCWTAAEMEKGTAMVTARQINCPASRIAISNMTSRTWTARGCQRAYQCWLTSPDNKTRCREEEGSKEQTARRVVIDRLALESGCAKTRIRVVQASEWSRGGEQAYRLTACGGAYVCTTKGSGTDCKKVGNAPPPVAAPVARPVTPAAKAPTPMPAPAPLKPAAPTKPPAPQAVDGE